MEASGETYEQALANGLGKELIDAAARHGMHALSPEEIQEQMPKFAAARG